jgi:hypothetical protein
MLHAIRRRAAVTGTDMARDRCSLAPRRLSRLAPSDKVTRWVQDPTLVSPDGLFGTARMWVMLRVIPGFDLPDFLMGTRLAYGTATRLMYARDWVALEPLVSKELHSAMQETMDIFGAEGRRVMLPDAEDAIDVKSAVLRRVAVLEGEEDAAGRRCHMDVLITSHEKWSLYDYNEKAAIPPFDGRMNVQEATWRFEGTVAPPEDADGDSQGEQSWIIHSIV